MRTMGIINYICKHTHFYEILFPSICRHGLAYFPQQFHVEVNQQFRNCKNKRQQKAVVQTSLLQLSLKLSASLRPLTRTLWFLTHNLYMKFVCHLVAFLENYGRTTHKIVWMNGTSWQFRAITSFVQAGSVCDVRMLSVVPTALSNAKLLFNCKYANHFAFSKIYTSRFALKKGLWNHQMCPTCAISHRFRMRSLPC